MQKKTKGKKKSPQASNKPTLKQETPQDATAHSITFSSSNPSYQSKYYRSSQLGAQFLYGQTSFLLPVEIYNPMITHPKMHCFASVLIEQTKRIDNMF